MQVITVEASLDVMPLFVLGGSVVPMRKTAAHNVQETSAQVIPVSLVRPTESSSPQNTRKWSSLHLERMKKNVGDCFMWMTEAAWLISEANMLYIPSVRQAHSAS